MPMARSPTAFGEDSYDQTGRDELPTTQGLRRGRFYDVFDLVARARHSEATAARSSGSRDENTSWSKRGRAGARPYRHATNFAALSASISWPNSTAYSIKCRIRGDMFSLLQISPTSTRISGSRSGT